MRRDFDFFREVPGKKRKAAGQQAWLSRELKDKELIKLLERKLQQVQDIKLIKRCAKRTGLRLWHFNLTKSLKFITLFIGRAGTFVIFPRAGEIPVFGWATYLT